MRSTGQPKNLAANSLVTSTVALVVIVALLALCLGGTRGAEGSPAAAHPYSEQTALRSETDSVIATSSALTAPPVLFDNPGPELPRRIGVQGNVVGEHPNLHPSPIATAHVVVEPGDEFRRTVAPGVPYECDRYRPLVQEIGEWDPDVVLALVWRESLCNERAVSQTNDWGLLQLNATCWAGKGIDGLPGITRLPDSIDPPDLQCDGTTDATPAAQWCYHAKEQAIETGRRPPSPCDAWLDPATNLETAHEIWLIRGWQPWCFDDASRATPACDAAAVAASAQQPEF